MTEQNRRYVIWRVKGLAEQEYGPQHPITKKLASMHEEARKLLRRHSPHTILDIQGLIPQRLGLHGFGLLQSCIRIHPGTAPGP